MQSKRNVATWLGTVLGLLLALALNASFAHAEDSGWVREEFHQTYPLTADGRVSLKNINGAVHISAWDQNQVKVDAVKRAEDSEELKKAEIRVDAKPDSIAISTHYSSQDEGWTRRNHNSASVEYTITVPRNAHLEDLQLVNGGLDINGVLGEVRAQCVNGKLIANG